MSDTHPKPCPFCGDRMKLWDHDTHAIHISTESNCPIRHQAILVEQWNDRTETEAKAMVTAALQRAAQTCKDDVPQWARDAGQTGPGDLMAELILALITTDHAAALEAVKAQAWADGYNARCDDEDGDSEKPTENPFEVRADKVLP